MRFPFVLCLALSLVLASGCSWHPWRGKPASESVGSREVPREKRQLPPKQAAEACVATAERMQERGKLQQAVFLYEKAREHDPDVRGVAHNLAVLHDANGDAERAKSEYRRALAEAPDDPDLLNDMGYYYYNQGDLDEAESWYRRALVQRPNHREAMSNLALVLGHQGRFDESLRLFTQVVGRAAALSNVGILMAQHGRREEARCYLTDSLAIDPSLPQAKAALQRLDGTNSMMVETPHRRFHR